MAPPLLSAPLVQHGARSPATGHMRRTGIGAADSGDWRACIVACREATAVGAVSVADRRRVDRLLVQRDVDEVGDLLRALRTSTRLPATSLAVSVSPEWRTMLPAHPGDAHAFFGWTIVVRPVTKNIATEDSPV